MTFQVIDNKSSLKHGCFVKYNFNYGEMSFYTLQVASWYKQKLLFGFVQEVLKLHLKPTDVSRNLSPDLISFQVTPKGIWTSQYFCRNNGTNQYPKAIRKLLLTSPIVGHSP